MHTTPTTRAGAVVLLAALLSACAGDGTGGPAAAPGGPALTYALFQKPTKTATGYWERGLTFDWTLDKTVSPATAALDSGATATFNYTLTASRTVADSVTAAGVRGQICVKNLGNAPSQGMVVGDIVEARTTGAWNVIATENVDISGNPVVDPGETACFDYDVSFTPVPGATYRNQGTVTWTNAGNGGVGDPGTTQTWETEYVPFTLPGAPATAETDEAAALADILTCPTGFTCTPAAGSWSLTGSQVIQYAVQVTNVSAACETSSIARNVATLTELDSGQLRADSAAVTITTEECAPPPPPPPPPGGTEGCTPGYWKQSQHFGNWVGYVPTGANASRYNTVFGVNLFSANTTLLAALGKGGGGAYRLGRHSSAALLNASNSSVDYGMTTAQVIAAVQAAVASGNYDAASDQFERFNERGCDLGRAP